MCRRSLLKYVNSGVLTTPRPDVDARLPDGTRVHAILSTIAAPGTCLSLRESATRKFSLEDMISRGHDLGGCRFDLAKDGERQAGLPDQRWNGIRQDESAVKTLLGWRIAAVPDSRSASLSAADEYVSWARLKRLNRGGPRGLPGVRRPARRCASDEVDQRSLQWMNPG
jgi:hypothetical protein